MQPNYPGLYRALVTSTSDPTNSGKIKVQCPQISGSVEIRATEPSNPQEPIPPVGSTVWIAFSGGDITKPTYITNQAQPSALTSTTLPVAPFIGQLVYETDTSILVIWDGFSWNNVWPIDADSAWQSYTPTWTGLSALGTGFVSSGRYQVTGHVVNLSAMLIGGTGTSLGTSNIVVSLPISSSSAPNASFGWTGTGRFDPTGGMTWHPLNLWLSPGSSAASLFAIRQSDIGWVSPGTAGYSWVAGSIMNVNITYEI
jgi:Type VI secretion system/phage-baseplate injector OB domain